MEERKFHVYTSDTMLLEALLANETLMKYLTDVEYTSEQFERDSNKDRLVHTDILIKKHVDEFCYKVMFKQNWSDPARRASTFALLELLEANPEHVVWSGYDVRERMRNGSLWDNQHGIYTDDENLVTMMWLVAKPAIHKVYKVVQKENNK